MYRKTSSFLIHSVSLSVPYVADLILKFVVIRMIVSRLGAELLGTLGIFQAVVLFPIFLQQSLSFALFLQVSRNRNQNNTTFAAFILSVLLSVVLGVLIVLFSPLLISLFRIPPSFHEMALKGFWLTAMILLLTSISQVFLSQLQAHGKFPAVGTIILAGSLLNSLLDVFLLRAGYGILALLAVDVLTNFLFCVAGFYLCSPLLFKKSTLAISKSATVQLLHETKRQLIIRSAATILWELDPLIVSRFFGVTSMASYWIARKIPYILKNLIWTGATPAIPSATDDSSLEESNLKHVFWLQVFLILPVSVFLWIYSRNIIEVWIGPAYQNAATWMRILLFAITMDVLPVTFFYFFLAKEKNAITLRLPAYAATVKFILSAVACLINNVELLMFATAGGALVFLMTMFRAILRETTMSVSALIQPFLTSAFSCSIAFVTFHFIPAPVNLVQIGTYALLFGGVAYGINLIVLRQFYPALYLALLSHFRVFIRTRVNPQRVD
jgi:O-antigen/teichoic acid export membrane protein